MVCSSFRRRLPGRESACLDVKHIGKPCTGERYARFDEGGQGFLSPTLRMSSLSALTLDPLRYFNSSPDVIRLAVMMYIRQPLPLRQVEDVLIKSGIGICHEAVRFWWNRFGPIFAGEVRRRCVEGRNGPNWRWHLDEVFVRIKGERHYLWCAVDHEGEVLEVIVTKRRDRRARHPSKLRPPDYKALTSSACGPFSLSRTTKETG